METPLAGWNSFTIFFFIQTTQSLCRILSFDTFSLDCDDPWSRGIARIGQGNPSEALVYLGTGYCLVFYGYPSTWAMRWLDIVNSAIWVANSVDHLSSFIRADPRWYSDRRGPLNSMTFAGTRGEVTLMVRTWMPPFHLAQLTLVAIQKDGVNDPNAQPWSTRTGR